MIRIKPYLLLSLTLLLPAGLYAQSGAQFLNIPADAASAATGGVAALSRASAFSGIVNPAGIALSEKTMAAGVNYMKWQPGESANDYLSMSGYYKVTDRLALSLSGVMFLHKSYEMSSDQGVFAGTFKPKEYSVAVGAAYRIVGNLSAGVNLRYIGSQLSSAAAVPGYKDASAFAADISVMYRFRNFNFVAGASNLGSKLKYGSGPEFRGYDLPAAATLGAAYGVAIADGHIINVGARGEYLLYGKEMVAGAGAEYAFKEMVFVRGGYRYGNSEQVVPSYFSAGLGVEFFGVTLDGVFIIAQKDSPLKNSFGVTIGYEF